MGFDENNPDKEGGKNKEESDKQIKEIPEQDELLSEITSSESSQDDDSEDDS